MEWWFIIVVILGGLMLLLATGIPIAFGFLVINLIGAYILWGGAMGIMQLTSSIYSSVTMFALLPVPLFVMMGELLLHSKLAFKAIDVVDNWLGSLPGRLSLVTLFSGTLFSCLSGSSLGTTAMLGRVMLPEMERRGYKPSMSIGSCMRGGLAMIIPPSAMAVILASVARVSVGKVLMGGIMPGLLLATLYTFYIVGRCKLQAGIAPAYIPQRNALGERLRLTIKYMVPLGVIIFVVVGLIFLGAATPTESAAMGAAASLLLAVGYGRMSWRVLKESISGTLRISCMMFMILTGSLAFSQMLAYTGATSGFVQWVMSLPLSPIVLIIAMQIVLLILGTFMEQVSIIMITMPIFIPLVKSLGYNDVWFTLIVLVNLEVAMKTPPFGFLLFIMRGITGNRYTMNQIYQATFPFVLIDVIGIVIMISFPAFVMWLVN